MLATIHQTSLGFIIHDIARLMRYRFDARARDLGVTRPQWRTLLMIARDEGTTQAALADQLEVERITMCRMIDRLSEAGLVERRADPRDRRVWRLHLLPAAMPIVEKLAKLGAELEAEALANLDAESIDVLRASLERVQGALRKPCAEAGDRRDVAA